MVETSGRIVSNNKIVQWSLEMYAKKQSNILSEDEKDGEVRIIEKL